MIDSLTSVVPAQFAEREGVYRALCDLLAGGPEAVDWAGFSPLDWARLAGMAEVEGVGPLLYWHIRQKEQMIDRTEIERELVDRWPAAIPAPVIERLSGLYYNTAAANALLFDELGRIMRGLNAAGIQPVILKGAALAFSHYPDPGLRPMGDLDLLVYPADLENAVEIVESLGYREAATQNKALNRRIGHHVQLSKGAKAERLVELHWSLIAGEADRRTPALEWFWEQVEPAAASGFLSRDSDKPLEALQFRPPAELLYLTSHLTLQHNWQERLIWYYDLHLLIGDRANPLDWDAALTQAETLGWSAILCQKVEATRQRFGTLLPDSWPVRIADILADRQAGKTGPQTGAGSARQTAGAAKPDAGEDPAALDWQRMQALRGEARLRFILALILPAPAYMRRRYTPRPAWLWPLAYPYRWGRMLQAGVSELAGRKVRRGG